MTPSDSEDPLAHPAADPITAAFAVQQLAKAADIAKTRETTVGPYALDSSLPPSARFRRSR